MKKTNHVITLPLLRDEINRAAIELMAWARLEALRLKEQGIQDPTASLVALRAKADEMISRIYIELNTEGKLMAEIDETRFAQSQLIEIERDLSIAGIDMANLQKPDERVLAEVVPSAWKHYTPLAVVLGMDIALVYRTYIYLGDSLFWALVVATTQGVLLLGLAVVTGKIARKPMSMRQKTILLGVIVTTVIGFFFVMSDVQQRLIEQEKGEESLSFLLLFFFGSLLAYIFSSIWTYLYSRSKEEKERSALHNNRLKEVKESKAEHQGLRSKAATIRQELHERKIRNRHEVGLRVVLEEGIHRCNDAAAAVLVKDLGVAWKPEFAHLGTNRVTTSGILANRVYKTIFTMLFVLMSFTSFGQSVDLTILYDTTPEEVTQLNKNDLRALIPSALKWESVNVRIVEISDLLYGKVHSFGIAKGDDFFGRPNRREKAFKGLVSQVVETLIQLNAGDHNKVESVILPVVMRELQKQAQRCADISHIVVDGI